MVSRVIVGSALAAVLLAPAFAEEAFQKLNGAQIRAKISGMEISDDVHWREIFERGGKVSGMSMSRKRTGKWRVDKDLLCIEFEKETPNCYEVWIAGKKVKLQREGILPLEGVIGPPSGRV